MRRRYSNFLSKEMGALDKTDTYLDLLYTAETRRRKVLTHLIWIAVNLVISAYVLFVLYFFFDSWERECVRNISIWLTVFLLIMFLHLIRSVLMIFMWMKLRDPTLGQIKLELFYGTWVFLFEAAWCIYGSTFIYSEEMD